MRNGFALALALHASWVPITNFNEISLIFSKKYLHNNQKLQIRECTPYLYLLNFLCPLVCYLFYSDPRLVWRNTVNYIRLLKTLSVPWSKVNSLSITLVLVSLSSSNFFHHPALPSTICFATSNGSITPFIRSSVTALMASRHASIGDRHTYQPAQKNPTGQARNQRTRNQMIAHSTFMSSSSFT